MSWDLSAVVKSFCGKRIAVVGDLMLDCYVWGKVDRISPEAPVPVVRVEKVNFRLGGAGNVLRNIATLGGIATAFGAVGNDAEAEEMFREFASYGINTDNIVTDDTRRTTVKRRILAGSQQLIRVDYEDSNDSAQTVRKEIAARLNSALRKGSFDAVIIEDYAKGLLTEDMAQSIVDTANECGVPVILDPKPRHRMYLHGLTLIKPNRSEAYAMAALPSPDAPDTAEQLTEVAKRIKEAWGTKNLLISLASEGMALFEEDTLTMLPTKAQEVYDVCGAGDTVIAAVSLGLAAGNPAAASAAVANHAAGIVVAKVGTVTVSADELLTAITGNAAN